MNKEYVQQYVGLEKTHWWFIARKKIISSFIEKYISATNLQVLNIGAAGGESSEWLSKYGEITSVENDPGFLQHLRSSDIDAVDASINELPFSDNSFDMVCAFDVLEHVDDDKQALKELERVCKPSGFIMLTVPALKSLWSNHDVVNQHRRRYDKKEFESIIGAGNSLAWQEISYFNFLLLAPIFLARKFSNLFQKNKKPVSDFENFKTGSLLNMILKHIFLAEVGLLKRLRVPFGVSLIGVLQKKKQPDS